MPSIKTYTTSVICHDDGSYSYMLGTVADLEVSSLTREARESVRFADPVKLLEYLADDIAFKLQI